MDFFQDMFAYLDKHVWIFKIIITILIFAGVSFIVKIVSALLKKKFPKKEKQISLFTTPTYIFLWLMWLIISLDIIAVRFEIGVIKSYITAIRNTIIIFYMSSIILRWKKAALNRLSRLQRKGKKVVDSTSVELMGKLSSMLIIIIATTIIMQLFGINIMPIVAFGGIGVAAVGLASKDVLANFFGGMMLHITRPFSMGDLVEFPHAKIVGNIEDIGWYLTCIRDLNKSPVYVPNSMFSTAVILNVSRTTNRRVDEKIPIRFKDFAKIIPIIDKINEFLKVHQEVERTLPIFVYLSDISTYSLDIIVRVYTTASGYGDFMAIRQDILLGITSIIKESGAEIPYPTTTLEVKEKPKI
jgi:MscS family membrane protein